MVECSVRVSGTSFVFGIWVIWHLKKAGVVPTHSSILSHNSVRCKVQTNELRWFKIFVNFYKLPGTLCVVHCARKQPVSSVVPGINYLSCNTNPPRPSLSIWHRKGPSTDLIWFDKTLNRRKTLGLVNRRIGGGINNGCDSEDNVRNLLNIFMPLFTGAYICCGH